jgi:hypothetical protein
MKPEKERKVKEMNEKEGDKDHFPCFRCIFLQSVTTCTGRAMRIEVERSPHSTAVLWSYPSTCHM